MTKRMQRQAPDWKKYQQTMYLIKGLFTEYIWNSYKSILRQPT